MLLSNMPLFLLALLLGIKHAFDADHIIAISTYIPKSKSLEETLKMSVSWAIGHMVTAGIITLLLFFNKETFLPMILEYFELIVGIMLVALGLISVITSRGFDFFHRHRHDHDGEGHHHSHLHGEGEAHSHYHKHMFGIGIVQGLASNDELIILFTASLGVATLLDLISYLAIYTSGVVIGMVIFGTALSYPILKSREERIIKSAMLLLGLISIIYGVLILKKVF